jgi:hypothetical protein
VEARLANYAGAKEDRAQKKIKGWKIRPLKKELDRIFKNRDKIVAFNTGKDILYFTPVTDEIIDDIKIFHQWLHFSKEIKSSGFENIYQLKSKLNNLLPKLAELYVGNLLAPPYVQEIEGGTHLCIPFEIKAEESEFSQTYQERAESPSKERFLPDMEYKLLSQLPPNILQLKLFIVFGATSLSDLLRLD